MIMNPYETYMKLSVDYHRKLGIWKIWDSANREESLFFAISAKNGKIEINSHCNQVDGW